MVAAEDRLGVEHDREEAELDSVEVVPDFEEAELDSEGAAALLVVASVDDIEVHWWEQLVAHWWHCAEHPCVGGEWRLFV